MKRPLLKHPAVIAGVVLGLMAVTLLNIQTFGHGRESGGPRDGAIHERSTPPADLDDVVRDAVDPTTGAHRVAMAGQGAGPSLTRDPFSGARQAPPSRPATPPARQPSRSEEPLVCTAVMLGGDHPVALIAGRSYGPGDEIRGHEILSIDTEGVVLRRADGSSCLLPVGPAPGESATFHVVTESTASQDPGQTRLESGRPERTER